jgi:hypothetical protein
MFFIPARVLIEILSPKTAWEIVNYASVNISKPSLLKYGSDKTFILMIKSPGLLPESDIWPLLETLKFCPAATPFGMLTFS